MSETPDLMGALTADCRLAPMKEEIRAELGERMDQLDRGTRYADDLLDWFVRRCPPRERPWPPKGMDHRVAKVIQGVVEDTAVAMMAGAAEEAA